jgi:hypothetical protein
MDTITKGISKAGSSKERILAFAIVLASLAHGIYFPHEWLGFGVLIFAYALWRQKGLFQGAASPVVWTITDNFFMVMLGLTIWGLWQPVKVAEGLLGICRWATFWYVYRWAREISNDSQSRHRLIYWIQITAVLLAGAGWFIGIVNVLGRPEDILGRLSSWLGYSNSAAAFLGAVLLLKPRSFSLYLFLGISLLSTGSRFAIGLYVFVCILDYLVRFFRKKKRFKPQELCYGVFPGRNGACVFRKWILMIAAGLALSALLFKPAWVHLAEWGFGNSSWGVRLLYYQDGFKLAWIFRGLPHAGGWSAFPTVQQIPYWTADPHSSLITVLLNQGIPGLLSVLLWIILVFRKRFLQSSKTVLKSPNLFAPLIFLVLHSLVDADSSFGILGILFWILFGLDNNLNSELFSSTEMKQGPFKLLKSLKPLMRLVPLVFSILLLTGSLSLALKPNLLNAGELWSLQAKRPSEKDSSQSINLLHKSLFWDQTKVAWQRQLAELEFQRGNIGEGLKQTENALNWQGLDLGAYEWAQSLVWQIAVTKDNSGFNSSAGLYNWVENIPARIESKRLAVSEKKRWLWQGSTDFRPTPHIMLLAGYAQQRQLTK